MSKELIEKLREKADSLTTTVGVMTLLHEAADALEAKAAPVAYITGQFAGRCIIEAINRAAVLPTGMALYSRPQPSAGVVMPERKVAQHGDVLSFQGEGWNACLDEFARLNKGAGSHE